MKDYLFALVLTAFFNVNFGNCQLKLALDKTWKNCCEDKVIIDLLKEANSISIKDTTKSLSKLKKVQFLTEDCCDSLFLISKLSRIEIYNLPIPVTMDRF